jgi:mRNA interferase MazF
LSPYEPDAGDLVWTDFDPRLGREQAARRPALIISPMEFWRATRFAFVAPITSRVRPFPSSIVVPAGLKISGEALLGQMRSIDTLARPLLPSGERIDADLLAEARAKLGSLLGISA